MGGYVDDDEEDEEDKEVPSWGNPHPDQQYIYLGKELLDAGITIPNLIEAGYKNPISDLLEVVSLEEVFKAGASLKDFKKEQIPLERQKGGKTLGQYLYKKGSGVSIKQMIEAGFTKEADDKEKADKEKADKEKADRIEAKRKQFE